jgi:uncharacterized protein YdcH (DUF465 family)
MSHVPHELAEEFPGQEQKIHELKIGDAHFASLADKYHEVNRAVHRAETNIEPTDDANLAQMRKERLALKDEIARAIAAA